MNLRGIARTTLWCCLLACSLAIRFWPLVAFWLAFAALVAYRHWRPDSSPGRGLDLAFGPTPHAGERRSHFLVRVAGACVAAFGAIAGGAIAGAWLLHRQIEDGNPWVTGVLAFGLPVLAGMAALGGLASMFEAAWLRASGHDPVWNGEGAA